MRNMHHSISSFSRTFDLLSVAQSSRTPQSQKYSFPLIFCKVSLGAQLSSNSEIGFLEEQASPPPSLINCPCTPRTFFEVPVFLHFRRGCSEEDGKTTVPHRQHFGFFVMAPLCVYVMRVHVFPVKRTCVVKEILRETPFYNLHTSEEQEDCF